MMAIGSFSGRHHQSPMAEMNVVPLVDVMLVLLVIFIVTAPLLTHSVRIELPTAASNPNVARQEHIELGIRPRDEFYWNGERVSDAELPARFAAASLLQPKPELHIRADRDARYDSVARVLSAASRAGIARIGFLTAPPG